VPLAPGTILQHLYVRERLRDRGPGYFVEIGVGEGQLSRLLLDLGWRGVGYDLSEAAIHRAGILNRDAISAARYEIRHEDWLNGDDTGVADLVVSSMVIEHLADADEMRYFERCRAVLRDDGFVMLLVPASPAHWGIEDEIAGHIRRYTAEGLRSRLASLGWDVTDVAGLTYPVSNLLLPISNLLVRRAESSKQALPMAERTARSGVRDVPLKTRYPQALSLLLNDITLYPFHLLQKACRHNPSCLVLYAEAVRR
jgi:SAM-dependent methyltransferase